MMLPTRQATKDNFEAQMGINHFSHFFLTSLLWNLIKKTAQPRIIVVSSMAHQGMSIIPKEVEIDWNDINYLNNYNPAVSYSRSKAANILFARELQRKMDEEKIDGKAVCLHPGAVRTELARDVSLTFKVVSTILSPLRLLMFKSANQGAQTSLYLTLEEH